jgi:hypothetical protein
MERIERSIIAGLGGAVVDGVGFTVVDALAPISIYIITIFFLHRYEGPE